MLLARKHAVDCVQMTTHECSGRRFGVRPTPSLQNSPTHSVISLARLLSKRSYPIWSEKWCENLRFVSITLSGRTVTHELKEDQDLYTAGTKWTEEAGKEAGRAEETL